MTDNIYVSGNDGSGKSTYAYNYVENSKNNNIIIEHRHYYNNLVRVAIRGLAGLFFSVATVKKSITSDTETEIISKKTSFYKKSSAPYLLYSFIYQSMMALEIRIRAFFSSKQEILYDRSFLDDIVSTMSSIGLGKSVALLRWCAFIFPVSRLYFLHAGHEIEYSRIKSIDLSSEFHRNKELSYKWVVKQLESFGVPIVRVDTST